MKNILLIFALLLTAFGYSQTAVKKSSIDSGGTTATNGNTGVVYTIGEVAVQENTQGNTHVSEGFIGPDIATLVGIQDYGTLQSVAVYPNPVVDFVQINLPEYDTYEIRLFDLNGKELWIKQVENVEQTQYDLSRLQTGTYLLVIIDRKHKLSRIVKLQKS